MDDDHHSPFYDGDDEREQKLNGWTGANRPQPRARVRVGRADQFSKSWHGKLPPNNGTARKERLPSTGRRATMHELHAQERGAADPGQLVRTTVRFFRNSLYSFYMSVVCFRHDCASAFVLRHTHVYHSNVLTRCVVYPST